MGLGELCKRLKTAQDDDLDVFGSQEQPSKGKYARPTVISTDVVGLIAQILETFGRPGLYGTANIKDLEYLVDLLEWTEESKYYMKPAYILKQYASHALKMRNGSHRDGATGYKMPRERELILHDYWTMMMQDMGVFPVTCEKCKRPKKL